MNTFTRATALPAFLLVLSGWTHAAETPSAAPAPFAVASVRFEQNATDGDMEVVFEVKAGKDGLAELSVVSPDGRTVVAFKAPDASTLGMRQFVFESPEPADLKAVSAAYPEGDYEFSGTTSAGARFVGKSRLSHRLPATATFVKPAPQATVVSTKTLDISWKPVAGVASYRVGVKQSELNVNFTALLPGSTTSFALPGGFLSPGRKYQLSIGTITREGNASFVETTFSTTKQ